MEKSRIVTIIILATLSCSSIEAAPLNPAEEARLFAEVRRKWQQYTTKYSGDFSRRSTVLKEYDPDSGKLKKTKELRADFFNYLYKPPYSHVISCKVDGKKADLGDCKPRGKRKVFHHVFDSNGHSHYAVKVVSTPTIRGVPCYKIKVTPKKRTDRHFMGHLYLEKKTMRLVLMEGTAARFPFMLKEMWLKMYFKQMPGHPGIGVISDGTMLFRVKIPLIIHMRIKGRFRAWGHRLIRR